MNPAPAPKAVSGDIELAFHHPLRRWSIFVVSSILRACYCRLAYRAARNSSIEPFNKRVPVTRGSALFLRFTSFGKVTGYDGKYFQTMLVMNQCNLLTYSFCFRWATSCFRNKYYTLHLGITFFTGVTRSM